MTALRRTVTGEFEIKDSIQIEEISEEKIISIEKLFDKKIDVSSNMKKLINGEEIKVDLEDGLYNLYSDEYVGIGKVTSKKLKREIIL
jgi:tRNA U55 pseudouridine synthase TruB